jgi:NhaP-type Na+/H+ or K+/H+ antiporter
MGLIGLLKICGYEKNNPNALTFKELVFIWYAGMIRGAIAFGLVLKIEDDFPNKELITTTCLALVVFTTIVFGSTVGLLSDCLFRKENEEKKLLLKQATDNVSQSEKPSQQKESNLMLHPNFERSHTAKISEESDSCWESFNRKYVKPTFCFKYSPEYHRFLENFQWTMMENNEEMEHMYEEEVEKTRLIEDEAPPSSFGGSVPNGLNKNTDPLLVKASVN